MFNVKVLENDILNRGIIDGVKIIDGKGFHLKFKNGYTISTQFGYGNYCDNYRNEGAYNYMLTKEGNNPDCKNSEIAIWDESGAWVTGKIINEIKSLKYLDLNPDDMVCGYVDFEQWKTIVEYLMSL